MGHQGDNVKIQASNAMQRRLISDVAGSGRMDNPRLRCALISVKTIAVVLPRMRSQVRVAAIAWGARGHRFKSGRPDSFRKSLAETTYVYHQAFWCAA